MSTSAARVDYFAMGGTIASSKAGQPGAVANLTAHQIAASIPGLDRVADLRNHQFLLTPSPEITLNDLLRLLEAMRAAVESGSVGIVVTQGTDTIEETAFALDLLWDLPQPIIVTGAMRNPSVPGPDGPANLLAAIQLARSEEAIGAGVMVCLNDEIHAARYVRKTHTSRPSAFHSPGLGPIGWVAEGRPVVAFRPSRRVHLPAPPADRVPEVALLKPGIADDCRLFGAVLDLGYEAVVIEALGGGHVPSAALPWIDKLVAEMPVVLASRTGMGEVLSETYRFPGSEIDLLERGVLRAGALDAAKARVLLILALAVGYDGDQLKEILALVGSTTGPISSTCVATG